MTDPIKMSIQKARIILDSSSRWNTDYRKEIPYPISAAEVQALAQAFIDLTMANGMLEESIDALNDNAAGEVL